MQYLNISISLILVRGCEACRRLRRKAGGEGQKLSCFCFSRGPCIPRIATAHYMTSRESGEPQIMHARAKRKRSGTAVLTGNTEDTLSCLRGAVSGGAEKNKDPELPQKSFGKLKILYYLGQFMSAIHPLLFAFSRGHVIKIFTFVPFPGVLSICMSQPCAFTRCFTIARPRPVPPMLRERPGSTR